MSATPAVPLTVAVLADSPIVRQRLINLVGTNRHWLGIDARSGERRRPDILLIDVDDDEPAQMLRRAGDPAMGLVLLATIALTGDWVAANGSRGALGVLPRTASDAQITAAVAAVAARLSVFTPQNPSRLRPVRSPSKARGGAERVEALTDRETAVLKMIAAGLSNKMIARELGITGHTVKYHVASVFGKLEVASRAEAVLAGIQLGLILI